MSASAQVRPLLLSILLACLVSAGGFLLITLVLAVALGPGLVRGNPEGGAGVLLIAAIVAACICIVAMIPLTLLFFTRLCKRYRSARKPLS